MCSCCWFRWSWRWAVWRWAGSSIARVCPRAKSTRCGAGLARSGGRCIASSGSTNSTATRSSPFTRGVAKFLYWVDDLWIIDPIVNGIGRIGVWLASLWPPSSTVRGGWRRQCVWLVSDRVGAVLRSSPKRPGAGLFDGSCRFGDDLAAADCAAVALDTGLMKAFVRGLPFCLSYSEQISDNWR